MRPTTMRCARTWRWGKTRPPVGQSSGPAPLLLSQSCPGCTTITSGYDFREGQEAATRLPRAAQLSQVPGLASVGGFDDSCRSPRSLEPKHLVPPDAVVLRRDRRRWPMMGLIAGILSTPI